MLAEPHRLRFGEWPIIQFANVSALQTRGFILMERDCGLYELYKPALAEAKDGKRLRVGAFVVYRGDGSFLV